MQILQYLILGFWISFDSFLSLLEVMSVFTINPLPCHQHSLEWNMHLNICIPSLKRRSYLGFLSLVSYFIPMSYLFAHGYSLKLGHSFKKVEDLSLSCDYYVWLFWDISYCVILAELHISFNVIFHGGLLLILAFEVSFYGFIWLSLLLVGHLVLKCGDHIWIYGFHLVWKHTEFFSRVFVYSGVQN